MAGKAWLDKEEVERRVKNAAVNRLAKAALLVEAEAKRSLNRGASKLGKRPLDEFDTADSYNDIPDRWQTNAQPGQPPNKRRGNLQNSIQSAKTPENTYVIGPATTAWYGRVMEFGALIKVTPKMRGFLWHAFRWKVRAGTIHIPRRPFMLPALQKVTGKFPDLFKNLDLSGGNA